MTIKEQMFIEIKNTGVIKKENYSHITNNSFNARKSEVLECIKYFHDGRSEARTEANKQWNIVFDHIDSELIKLQTKNMFYLTLASISSLITLLVIIYK